MNKILYIGPVLYSKGYVYTVRSDDPSVIDVWVIQKGQFLDVVGKYTGHKDEVTVILEANGALVSVDFQQNVNVWKFNQQEPKGDFMHSFKLQFGWVKGSVYLIEDSMQLLVLPYTGSKYQLYDCDDGQFIATGPLSEVKHQLHTTDFTYLGNTVTTAQGPIVTINSVHSHQYLQVYFESRDADLALEHKLSDMDFMEQLSISIGPPNVLIDDIVLSPLLESFAAIYHFDNEDALYPAQASFMVVYTLCPKRHSLYMGKCLSCDFPCQACIYNGGTCLACEPNYRLLDTMCIKLSCKPPCQDCRDGNPSICIGCPAKRYLEDKVSSCMICFKDCLTCHNEVLCRSCRVGKFLDRETCYNCVAPCASCASLDYCETCADTYYKHPKEQGQCLPCKLPCLNCLSATHCTQCVPRYYMQNSECATCAPLCLRCSEGCRECYSNRICLECDEGYMFSEFECFKCSSFCKDCLSDPNICSTCAADRTGLPSCKACLPTTYIDERNQQCVPCHYLCVECVYPGEMSSCTTCDAGRYLELRRHGHLGYCICMTDYYFKVDHGQLTCADCKTIVGCTGCIDGKCSGCYPGFLLLKTDLPVCRPMQNICRLECLRCDQIDIRLCLECAPPLKLYLYECLKKCPNNTIDIGNECTTAAREQFKDFERKLEQSGMLSTSNAYQMFLLVIQIFSIVYPGLLFTIIQVNLIACLSFSNTFLAPNFQLFLLALNQISPNLKAYFPNAFEEIAIQENEYQYITGRNFYQNELVVRSFIHYAGGFVTLFLAVGLLRMIIYVIYFSKGLLGIRRRRIVKLVIILIDTMLLLMLDTFSLTFSVMSICALSNTSYLNYREQWDVTLALTILTSNGMYLIWLFYVSQQEEYLLLKGVAFQKNAYRYYNFQLRAIMVDYGSTSKWLIHSYRVFVSSQYLVIPMVIILVPETGQLIIVMITYSSLQLILLFALQPEAVMRTNIVDFLIQMLIIAETTLVYITHLDIAQEMDNQESKLLNNSTSTNIGAPTLKVHFPIDLLSVESPMVDLMMIQGSVCIWLALAIIFIKLIYVFCEGVTYLIINRAKIRRQLWKLLNQDRDPTPVKSEKDKPQEIEMVPANQVQTNIPDKPVEVFHSTYVTQVDGGESPAFVLRDGQELYLNEMISNTVHLEQANKPQRTIFTNHAAIDQNVHQLITETDPSDTVLLRVASELLSPVDLQMLKKNVEKVSRDFSVQHLKLLMQLGLMMNKVNYNLACEVLQITDFFIKKFNELVLLDTLSDSPMAIFWVRMLQVFLYKVLHSFYSSEFNDLVFFAMKVSRYIMINNRESRTATTTTKSRQPTINQFDNIQ